MHFVNYYFIIVVMQSLRVNGFLLVTGCDVCPRKYDGTKVTFCLVAF